MIQTQYIPDLVGQVVAKVDTYFSTRTINPFAVSYDFGHYSEVNRNLTLKEGNPDKPLKYPLVWLVMDMEESVGKLGVYAEVNMNLIIAVDTTPTLTMQERRDQKFLPVLYPIYARLLEEFKNSKAFQTAAVIQHTKIDRPYWGIQDAQGNGVANLFNDYMDAVQIKNLKLTVKNIC